MIGVKTGVDDELNRLGAELMNGGDHFVGEIAGAGIDHHGAFVADLNGDIGAVAHQHVDIALNGQHVDLAVGFFGVDTRLASSGPGRYDFSHRGGIGGGRILQLRCELGIHGFRAAQRSEQRDLVFLGIFAEERDDGPKVVRNSVGSCERLDNLLAVVAGVEPAPGSEGSG